jgi:hypothetical protein
MRTIERESRLAVARALDANEPQLASAQLPPEEPNG